MKSTQRIVSVAVLFLAMQSLHAQVSSPDTMVHRIFASLKAKDQKAFVSLYPNARQFGAFIRGMMETMLKTPEMKKMMEKDEKSKNMNVDSLIDAQVSAASEPMAFAKMQSEFGNIFQKIIEKGESKGVKWNEATLTGYTLDSTTTEEGNPFQPSMKTLKGVISFNVGDSAYQLAYDKIFFLPAENGWFGAEFKQLARKGESLAPDQAEMEEGVDSVAVEKPSAKMAKPKAKQPAAKAKTGSTKSPARKTKTKS